MKEIKTEREEIIRDIPKKIAEYLDYGIDNGGWNSLLNIEQLEKDIFLIDSKWQENKVVVENGTSRGRDLIKEKIAEINNRIHKLKKISESIKFLLREIYNWQVKQDDKLRVDKGVVLRSLKNINSHKLTKEQKKQLNNLLYLLNEFVVEFEEWKIFKENKLDELIEILDQIKSGKIKLGNNKNLKSKV